MGLSWLNQRQRLIYPSGYTYGVNRNHVAVGSGGLVLLSLVAIPGRGSTFLNLLTTKAPSSTGGTPSSSLFGITGPGVTFTGASDEIDFAIASRTPTSFTAAAIANVNSLPATSAAATFMRPGNGVDINLFNSGGTTFMNISASTTETSTVTVTTGPWFFVWGGNTTNLSIFVARRLDTGALFTNSQGTLGTLGANGGTISIGNNAGTSNQPALSSIAALTYIEGHVLSISEAVKWSEDPWSFWYPEDDPTFVGKVAAAASAPGDYNSPIFRVYDNVWGW